MTHTSVWPACGIAQGGIASAWALPGTLGVPQRLPPQISSSPISHLPYSLLASAVCTAIHRPICLHTMTQDSAATMAAGGGKGLDCTLKAIKGMRPARHDHLKRLVIFIPACFAVCHVDDSSKACYAFASMRYLLSNAKFSALCQKREHKLCQRTPDSVFQSYVRLLMIAPGTRNTGLCKVTGNERTVCYSGVSAT
jgi:hypothetical protein